jgi:hypothetical protein
MKKALIIIVVSLIVILVMAGVGGYVIYQNSPQKVYVELSQAIRGEDGEILSQIVDCDSLQQNVLDGAAGEDFQCDELDLSDPLNAGEGAEDGTQETQFDEEFLAANILEAYTNGYLIRRGDTYEVEIPTVTQNEDDPELDITFIISQVDGQWKITDIDFGFIEELIQAFAEVGESFNSVDQDSEIGFNEVVTANQVSYEVLEAVVVDSLLARDFLDEESTITARDGKAFVRVLMKVDYSQQEGFDGFSIDPTYRLVSDSDEDDFVDALSFFDENYENIDSTFDAVDQSLLDEEAASQTDSSSDENSFGISTVETLDYEYRIFEVDEGFELSDYRLVLERVFVNDDEESFRFTLDL